MVWEQHKSGKWLEWSWICFFTISRLGDSTFFFFGREGLVYLALPGVVTVELVVAVVVVCSLSSVFVRRTRDIRYSMVHDIQHSAMQNVWE